MFVFLRTCFVHNCVQNVLINTKSNIFYILGYIFSVFSLHIGFKNNNFVAICTLVCVHPTVKGRVVVGGWRDNRLQMTSTMSLHSVSQKKVRF